MKTAIRIFVGGPTKLKPLRELVRTIANEVLSSWDDYGHQISIVVKSCDIYKGLQRQKEMNEYIKDEADLVLFILKDSIGDETKKEYRLAASQYAINQRPDYYVYLKQYHIYTPDIKEIEEVMKEPEQVYYTLYSDDNDLKAKIKDQIDRYVNNLISKIAISEIKNLNESICKLNKTIDDNNDDLTNKNKLIKSLSKEKRKHVYFTIISSLLALAFLAYSLFPLIKPELKLKPKSEPMLVFAGGGSVANFIQGLHVNGNAVDVRNYPNSVYVNMASGNAWSLLVEQTYNDGEMPFFPICLSASKIADDYINSNDRQVAGQGHIIGIKLGYDSLAIYIDSISATKWVGFKTDTDSTISAKTLNKLIINNKTDHIGKIFTTSSNSGTLRSYQNAIDKDMNIVNFDLMLEKKQSFIFFDSSIESYFRSIYVKKDTIYPYIVLGSDNYYVKDIPLNKIYVTNDNDSIIKKPIYLYFCVSSTIKNHKQQWIIEPQIVNFLKSIIDNRITKIDQWDNIVNDKYVKIVDTDNLVIHLNDDKL